MCVLNESSNVAVAHEYYIYEIMQAKSMVVDGKVLLLWLLFEGVSDNETIENTGK